MVQNWSLLILKKLGPKPLLKRAVVQWIKPEKFLFVLQFVQPPLHPLMFEPQPLDSAPPPFMFLLFS